MRLAILALATACTVGGASSAAVIIDGSTQGLYNARIGQALDGTNPYGDTFMFPPQNISGGDPSLDIPASSPPDLSTASAALGSWLSTPATPGGSWSASPMAIPSSWAVNSETAIIYTIDAGTTGLSNAMASFGVDNGLFVWLDGAFLGGHLRPGGVSLGEFVLSLGELGVGSHYLQVLREDHGGATGYSVEVTADATAVPLPAGLPLLAGALALLVGRGVRRRA